MAVPPDLDVALSFAGEDRAYVDQVAHSLRDRGVKVFYDRFDESGLWGKDLYAHLADVYQRRARFTVMFISAAYGERLWTNHERRAAQARAFEEGHEYILPARFDDTEIPGIPATVGYVSLIGRSPEDLAALIIQKLADAGVTVPGGPLRSHSDPISEPRNPAGPVTEVPQPLPKPVSEGARKAGTFRLVRYLGAREMAIDLGTANTRICLLDHGLVLDEPSMIGAEARNGLGRAKAVGEEAWLLQRSVETIRPLCDGAIVDLKAAQQMLRHFIGKARAKDKGGLGLEVAMAVPVGASQVQRNAFRDAAVGAGAGKVRLIDAPVAAAIGADMPVAEPLGSLVVDLGAGKTEIALISAFGLTYKGRVPTGGAAMDQAIASYVIRNHNLRIGPITAEKIKNQIGMATWSDEEEDEGTHVIISGYDHVNGGPKEISITRKQVREALSDAVSAILSGVRTAMEKIPPELAKDIIDQGIVLTGGVARLCKIDLAIQRESGLPVEVAEEPLTCVARGMGRILEDRKLRDALFGKQ